MSRWLFALLLLCSAGVAMAQTTEHEKTTDKVTVSELKVSPGAAIDDNEFITVSLEGNTIYTAFGMKIYLPQGYEFAYDGGELMCYISEEDMYPTNRRGKIDSHSLSCNVQGDGSLIVTVMSSETADMLSTSGPLFDLYVKATPYAKPGPADIVIKECFFTTSDAVQYDAEDQVISDKLSASSNCSLPFSITAKKKWSTRVFPFSMTEIPEGLSVYTYKSQDKENVYLTKQNSIEAYTPYIISTEKDMNITLTGTASAEEYTSHVKSGGTCGSDALKGAVKNQTVHRGYILQSQDGGECKFYPILDNEKFSIPTGKCWIDASVAGAKELKFIISDDADGIEATQLQAEVPEAVYDLQGRRTRASQHGIYIIDGKKVIK